MTNNTPKLVVFLLLCAAGITFHVSRTAEEENLKPEYIFSDEGLRRLFTQKDSADSSPRHARTSLVRHQPTAQAKEEDTTEDNGVPTASVLLDHAQDIASDQNTNNTAEVYDVIIVGAGWSGIAAAITLHASNITNIKVLEGRDYIGGRSYSKTNAWQDYDVDMGSMWLLYGSQNPLYQIANETDIDMVEYQYLSTLVSMEENETIGVQEFSEMAYSLYDYGYWYYRSAKSFFVDAIDEGLNVSAAEAFELIDDNAYYDAEDKKSVLKASLQEYLELMYAAKTEDMSLWFGVQGEESYLGGYYADDVTDRLLFGGFTTIVEALAAPVRDRIKTNSKVTKIAYKNKGVKVKYDDRSGDNVVEKIAYAKKVIVTVPHGVLSKNADQGGIKFRPLLPYKTRQSIDRIGMGQMIKMFLFWEDEDIFWPGDYDDAEQYMDKVTINSDFRITFYNPSFNETEKMPYLFTFMLGDEIFEIAKKYANSDEAKYEEELLKVVMVPLRNMFGDSVPDPVKVVATKWTEDEFSYGVYSFNKVGYLPNDRKRLREPIDNKIFLAGEATSTNHYATVHGAYYTGVMAATEVISSMNATNATDGGTPDSSIFS